MQKSTIDTAKEIAKLASTMKYYEWCRIKGIIDKKYSSEASKVTFENTNNLERLIEEEFNL